MKPAESLQIAGVVMCMASFPLWIAMDSGLFAACVLLAGFATFGLGRFRAG